MTSAKGGMRDLGLVTRLVAATLVAGIVTAAVGTVLLRASARDALRLQMEDRLVRAAERMATGVDDRVNATVEAVELVATREAVVELRPEASTELTVARRVLRSIERMTLYDRDGRPVAAVASRSLVSPSDMAPAPAIPELVADGRTVLRTTDQDQPYLEAIVPVEDPPGTVVGALIAAAPLDLVGSRVDTALFDFDGTAFLIDGSGRISVHPERDLVVRGETFDLRRFDGASVATFEDEGQRVLASYAPTTTFDGAVIVEQPERDALAPVGRELTQLTAILVAVVAVTVLAVSLVGRQLLRPLHSLAEAVSRLARGERSVRVSEHGAGEVGALAREFNRMADALEEHIDQLATSEERLRSILENTTSIVHVKDLEGRYVQVNRRFAELFEVDRDEVVGRTDHDLFPRDMADVYRHNDLQAVTTGEAVEVEELVFHDDGELHVYLSVKFPLRDGQGTIYGTCGISTDVTEHRRAERYQRQLEQARQRRQQALELNDSVVQGLAVGLYALQLGEDGQAREAIENTLEAAKGVIDRLLTENEEGMRPGDLIRSEPADVLRRRGDPR